MKKLIVSIPALLFLSLMLIVSGCKHGEDDPALSFKSRDSRVIGVWLLQSVADTITDTDNTNTPATEVTTETFDGTTWTTTIDGTVDQTRSYALILTIDKDGTVLAEETTDGEVRNESTDWTWWNSQKNKTKLYLPLISLKWFDGGSYHIRELRSKTLVLTANWSEKDVDTNGDMTEVIISKSWTFAAE